MKWANPGSHRTGMPEGLMGYFLACGCQGASPGDEGDVSGDEEEEKEEEENTATVMVPW